MNSVNKTLYIPLYGKSYVSKRGLFLDDKKAEEIWEAQRFKLRGKSASKWLAYYMGIRSAVFDDFVRESIERTPDAAVIHIGCGMDSRILRVGREDISWYDVDFPEVIAERRKYFSETPSYKMISADARESKWLSEIREKKHAIIIMEGVSMYMTSEEIKGLFANLSCHFERILLLMDCYSLMAARMSKYKNPINDVGVTQVYGVDDPIALQQDDITFVKERDMTPKRYIDELRGMEKRVFSMLYAGNFARRLYRLYEYRKV